MSQVITNRRRPIGAEVGPAGVHVRLWAPGHERVEVVVECGPGRNGRGSRPTFPLEAEDRGYFAGTIPGAAAGTRYRFRLDGSDRLLPDPASRFQPDGPEGPSMVVDPDAFAWSDSAWRGVELPGQVLYELHVGTFTPEGTFAAATRELPALAELGVTLIELMPVVSMPGRFGWGYDGVGLFAPFHHYGPPDDLRRLVDRAHALGLGVLLDVVDNHLGPESCSLPAFSEDYQTDRYQTEWGRAMNFDGPRSHPVREFFLTNAAYWVEEYHLDGFRFDATQEFHDNSRTHILTSLIRRVKLAARGLGRKALVIGENEPQQATLARPVRRGGCGLDALWNDDFHHVARVAATGRREAYYGDYHGSAQEFASLFRRGWLYQGQRNLRQGKPRGTPAFDLDPPQFINFLQNHDQIANSLRGTRLHQQTDPATFRALTAVLLLAPGTPMLFQGQEFAASSPFEYFGDLSPELSETMHRGRRDFLAQFPSVATPEARPLIPHPADPTVFERLQTRPRRARPPRPRRGLGPAPRSAPPPPRRPDLPPPGFRRPRHRRPRPSRLRRPLLRPRVHRGR